MRAPLSRKEIDRIIEAGKRTRFSVEGTTKHGMRYTREYRCYSGAFDRCRNPNNPAYARYGGRGIEFRFESFVDFYAALGPCPDSSYSVDRIDPDGHYEAGNVRWADYKTQNRNTRFTKLTPEKVRAIRQSSEPHRILAERYGISASYVSMVKRGHQYTRHTRQSSTQSGRQGSVLLICVLVLVLFSQGWASTTTTIVSSVCGGSCFSVAGPPGTSGVNIRRLPIRGIPFNSLSNGPWTSSDAALSEFASASAALAVDSEAWTLLWIDMPGGPCNADIGVASVERFHPDSRNNPINACPSSIGSGRISISNPKTAWLILTSTICPANGRRDSNSWALLSEINVARGPRFASSFCKASCASADAFWASAKRVAVSMFCFRNSAASFSNPEALSLAKPACLSASPAVFIASPILKSLSSSTTRRNFFCASFSNADWCPDQYWKANANTPNIMAAAPIPIYQLFQRETDFSRRSTSWDRDCIVGIGSPLDWIVMIAVAMGCIGFPITTFLILRSKIRIEKRMRMKYEYKEGKNATKNFENAMNSLFKAPKQPKQKKQEHKAPAEKSSDADDKD